MVAHGRTPPPTFGAVKGHAVRVAVVEDLEPTEMPVHRIPGRLAAFRSTAPTRMGRLLVRVQADGVVTPKATPTRLTANACTRALAEELSAMATAAASATTPLGLPVLPRRTRVQEVRSTGFRPSFMPLGATSQKEAVIVRACPVSERPVPVGRRTTVLTPSWRPVLIATRLIVRLPSASAVGIDTPTTAIAAT